MMSQKYAFLFIVLFLCIMPLYKGGCTIVDFRPEASAFDSTPIDTSPNPDQENFESKDESPILKDIDGVKALLTPKATYKIAGRVMSKRHYHMDWLSKLSPVDLAIAWGPVATDEYANQITFSHSDRYASYHYPGDFKGDPSLISNHAANEHLIPANSKIAKTIKSIKVNEVVELSGMLVNVEWIDEKNGPMNLDSSLTRDDIGAGACEIIYVTKVRINNKVYE
jgi:hypothetical protein